MNTVTKSKKIQRIEGILNRLLEKKELTEREKHYANKLCRRLGKKFVFGGLRKYERRAPRKYEIYINSQWWEKRKNLYFQSHKRQCLNCGSFAFIELHHLKYRASEFGYEKDEDLAPLCCRCHKSFHELFGVKKDNLKEFQLWLSTGK
jgi:hypothetical protein